MARRLIVAACLVAFCLVLASGQAFAADRNVLCIKKIGKTNIKGRDAYLAVSCRKGYFPVSLDALGVTSGPVGPAGATGPTGPKGADGAPGPQGAPGVDGGAGATVSGSVSICNIGGSEQPAFNPGFGWKPQQIAHCQLTGTGFTFRHVFEISPSFEVVLDEGSSSAQTQSFSFTNVPAGEYSLTCDITPICPFGSLVTAAKPVAVTVTETGTVDVGTIDLCDADCDSTTAGSDCDDFNPQVAEECGSSSSSSSESTTSTVEETTSTSAGSSSSFGEQ
jgi:hypothetical protein